MSNFGPAPSRMTAKISPSLPPRSHLSSVRSDGCVPSGAIGPLPFASAPWQKRQFFWNRAFPEAIDAALDATGFFIFFASALPPGFCAPAGNDANAIHPNTTAENTTRRMMARLLLAMTRTWLPNLMLFSRESLQRKGTAKAAPYVRQRTATISSAHDDDGDVLARDQRAVVGD